MHTTNDDSVIRFWGKRISRISLIGWEGHDEGNTHPNSETSARGLEQESSRRLLLKKQLNDATNKPNTVNTTMTSIEVAQLKVDNEELKADDK
jgi:hypothetical protein